jgi:hypothetical protein
VLLVRFFLVANRGDENDMKSRVLLEGVTNAAKRLGISNEQLVDYLGLHDIQILAYGTDAGRKALQLIDAYLSIYALTGADNEAAHWFNSRITTLKSAPIDILCQPGGIERLKEYLRLESGH